MDKNFSYTPKAVSEKGSVFRLFISFCFIAIMSFTVNVSAQNDTVDNDGESVVIWFLILIITAGIFLYMKKLRKVKKSDNYRKIANAAPASLIAVEEKESIVNGKKYISGIDLEGKINSEYYEINLDSMYESTVISKVYFSKRCITEIYRFFSDSLKVDGKTNETGCFIIGAWEYVKDTNRKKYNITLEEIVKPSDDAVYGEYELDFGVKIGITLETSIMNLREKTGKEYVHTAWMHSHPGLGLFLSSHDLTAQSLLSYNDHPNRMLAIVVDTNTPDFSTAFFSPRPDGTMNNININDHNDNSKLIVSLEALYRWAKNPVVANVKQQTYYEVNIWFEHTKIDKVLFNRTAVIDMDISFDETSRGLHGYYYGEIPYKQYGAEKNIILNDFKTKDDETQRGMRPIGSLLIEKLFLYNNILKKYTPIINRFDFCAIYESETENIYFIVKNDENIFPSTSEKIPFVSLMDLKKWTRKQ